jgi:short-subunit dehydrogenase
VDLRREKGDVIAMKNKIVAITGAGGGLGACLARKYSEAGATVVLLAISGRKVLEVAASLKNRSYVYGLDVSDGQRVSAVFDTIYAEVGDLDILVNCAGLGFFDYAEKIPIGSVDAMIDVNLKGTIFCTQKALGRMKRNDRGHIINIISMSGKRPVATESVYCASKYGVSGFTQAVALELENTAVRITGVYMGNMATGLWKGEKPENFDKFIRPEDMADIIFENARFRDYLSVEEIWVKNVTIS